MGKFILLGSTCLVDSSLEPHLQKASSLGMEVQGRSIQSKEVNVPMSEQSLYDAPIAALEQCISDLYDQAHEVSDSYMSFVDGVEGSAKGWQSRSTLQLSCTRKGNHLDLKWTGVRWFGKQSARTSIRVHIAKNATTLGYTEDKLKVFAKEWEIAEVMKAEQKLQVIRRQARHIVKAIISVRNAIKVAKANPGDSTLADDETDSE